MRATEEQSRLLTSQHQSELKKTLGPSFLSAAEVSQDSRRPSSLKVQTTPTEAWATTSDTSPDAAIPSPRGNRRVFHVRAKTSVRFNPVPGSSVVGFGNPSSYGRSMSEPSSRDPSPSGMR